MAREGFSIVCKIARPVIFYGFLLHFALFPGGVSPKFSKTLIFISPHYFISLPSDKKR